MSAIARTRPLDGNRYADRLAGLEGSEQPYLLRGGDRRSITCRELGDLELRSASLEQLRSQRIQSTTNLNPLAIKRGEVLLRFGNPCEDLVFRVRVRPVQARPPTTGFLESVLTSRPTFDVNPCDRANSRPAAISHVGTRARYQ